MPRPAAPLDPLQIHAARLSRLPGVTLAEASRRSGVPLAALRRARASLGAEAWPDRSDLVLAALTRSGERDRGPVADLASIAGFVDWCNHDGTTADEVPALLQGLVDRGLIELTAGQFRLLRRWP